ncbi:MAG TPA: hypothetical protein PLH92_06640 [Mycobacterium sp.]|uniref:hypothetical protein n=1 Tax=Mycolicibacterium sp. TaxID=2320850 RepID=UPI0025DDBAF6|nr:hypothetical protein [Mycolicibacterium sp.]HPX36655.1 hypothetical protein [Mycobacterium sp.]HQC76381.1 hypothetical protein [Mycobacterium sp.]
MRNRARVLVFDVAVPLVTIAGLVTIGVMLGWPLWWVSLGSMLCLLVVEAVVLNAVLYRRDSVTMGTDDDAPGLRLAAVGVAAATLVSAVVVGYTQWARPDRAFTRDTDEVARIAIEVSEATATFTPSDPASSIDRAAALMTPDSAAAFKSNFGAATADMAKRNISAQARTISAGLEALSPSAASVAVLMRSVQAAPGQEPGIAVLALRVALTKQDDGWKVVDVAPINSR